MSQGAFSDRENALFKLLYVRLASAIEGSRTIGARYIDPAAPGSPNARARAAGAWEAYELVTLFQYSGEDHLNAILMIFDGQLLPTYALYTLLRAAAEPIVRSAYLLDPAVTERTRLARALNIRLENLIEQNKVVPDAALKASRVAELVTTARRSGIDVVNEKKSDAVAYFDDPYPGEIGLFERYVQPLNAQPAQGEKPLGNMLYRYLSGQVHSMLWVKLSGVESSPTSDPGISSVKLDFEFEWFAPMLSLVLRVHEKNIVDLLGLSGFPAMVWEQVKKVAVLAAQRRYVGLAERVAREAAGGSA